MSEQIENQVVNVSMPYLHEALGEVEKRLENDKNKFELYFYLTRVLWLNMQDLTRCQKPQFSLSVDWNQDKTNCQIHYALSDRSIERTNAYNFHLQNTSQWINAGCIQVQFKENGDVSISSHT